MRRPSVAVISALLSLSLPLKAEEKAPGDGQENSNVSGVEFAEDVALKASDLVTPVVPVKTFPANYPSSLKRSCRKGTAKVRFVIGRDGTMSQLGLVNATCKELGEETLKTVAKWQFNPATVNGQPVAAYFHVTLNFKVDH